MAKVGGLAKSWSAEYEIIVNFDAGSGFLTGVAVRGVLGAPYGQKFADTSDESGKTIQLLGESAFVVPKDNLPAEWSALQGFIDKLAELIERADAIYQTNGWGRVHTQVCFWELRQYEELCNAFGRHLLRVLDLSGKSQRALAWVFPSEKLMELEDEICPSIVFIREIIKASVLLPERFAVTLLGTAEYYHHPSLTPRHVDRYYREPLGNAIPRERIFDIWKSPTGTVKLFGKVVSIADAIDRYGSVLKAHAYSLGSITARLRTDLKNVLSGKAPSLRLVIPSGMAGVAHDSKLWNQWSEVSTAADETEARLGLITRAEWLESSYKAIILETLVQDHGNHRYTFLVSEESTEAKIEEGDSYRVLGIVGWPGFPLQTPYGLGVGDQSIYGFYTPLHSFVAVKIEVFDRANRKATVVLSPRSSKYQQIFDELMDSGIVPIDSEPLYVLDGLPYDDTPITQAVLKAIGNPKCAKTAPESLAALGKSAAKKIPAGTEPDTPVGRILWAADKLSSVQIRSTQEANALAAFAKTANKHPLNDSQYDAVCAAAAVQLSIIWGPPGTGADSGRCRSAFRTDVDHRSEVMPISVPN